MATLVMAAAYSTAALTGQKMKLQLPAQPLTTAASRIFGVPGLHLHAIADG